jgi:hypothetical protein
MKYAMGLIILFGIIFASTAFAWIDGFEDNNFATPPTTWTCVSGNCTIQDSITRHGTYAAKMDSPYGYIQTTVLGMTTYATFIDTNVTDNGIFEIALKTSDESSITAIFADGNKFMVHGSAYDPTQIGTATYAVNTWYYLKIIYVDGANHSAVYVYDANGGLIDSNTWVPVTPRTAGLFVLSNNGNGRATFYDDAGTDYFTDPPELDDIIPNDYYPREGQNITVTAVNPSDDDNATLSFYCSTVSPANDENKDFCYGTNFTHPYSISCEGTITETDGNHSIYCVLADDVNYSSEVSLDYNVVPNSVPALDGLILDDYYPTENSAILVTFDNMGDLDEDTLNYYCATTPDANAENYDFCDGSIAYPYIANFCTGTAGPADGNHEIYCKLYDDINYSSEVSATYEPQPDTHPTMDAISTEYDTYHPGETVVVTAQNPADENGHEMLAFLCYTHPDFNIFEDEADFCSNGLFEYPYDGEYTPFCEGTAGDENQTIYCVLAEYDRNYDLNSDIESTLIVIDDSWLAPYYFYYEAPWIGFAAAIGVFDENTIGIPYTYGYEAPIGANFSVWNTLTGTPIGAAQPIAEDDTLESAGILDGITLDSDTFVTIVSAGEEGDKNFIITDKEYNIIANQTFYNGYSDISRLVKLNSTRFAIVFDNAAQYSVYDNTGAAILENEPIDVNRHERGEYQFSVAEISNTQFAVIVENYPDEPSTIISIDLELCTVGESCAWIADLNSYDYELIEWLAFDTVTINPTTFVLTWFEFAPPFTFWQAFGFDGTPKSATYMIGESVPFTMFEDGTNRMPFVLTKINTHIFGVAYSDFGGPETVYYSVYDINGFLIKDAAADHNTFTHSGYGLKTLNTEKLVLAYNRFPPEGEEFWPTGNFMVLDTGYTGWYEGAGPGPTPSGPHYDDPSVTLFWTVFFWAGGFVFVIILIKTILDKLEK